MKAIDVVIAISKALDGWDGTPGQAAEKLGAAVNILKSYSSSPGQNTCETCGRTPSIRCGCDWSKCGMWIRGHGVLLEDAPDAHDAPAAPGKIEIRNIHANRRYPGVVYGSLYIDGELNMSATLGMCEFRAYNVALERVP